MTLIKFWSYESLMLKFFVISAVVSHKHENIQQTSSFLFSIMNALLKISCKEYIYYKWSINKVKEELSIDESEYTQLKTRIWDQMRFLQLIKWKLNINKSKEIIRSTFEIIYHKFHIIFNNVARSRSDSMLMFMTQWSNYNVRKWLRIRETWWNNFKYNSSSFLQLKTHSHFLSYVVCNKWDFKRSQSVSVKLIKILIIQINHDFNYSICCRSQDLLKRESVKNSIHINDMKYNKFIKLIENELNYNCITDMMIYDWAEFARIYISNEHEWKTALKEMHAEESIHFLFTIQSVANNDCRFQISCDTWFKQLITEEIM